MKIFGVTSSGLFKVGYVLCFILWSKGKQFIVDQQFSPTQTLVYAKNIFCKSFSISSKTYQPNFDFPFSTICHPTPH